MRTSGWELCRTRSEHIKKLNTSSAIYFILLWGGTFQVSGGLSASPTAKRPPEASTWTATAAGRAKTCKHSASTTRARAGRPGAQSISRACTEAPVS